MTADIDNNSSHEAQAKRRVALWTVAIPAVVGLLGGMFSGGITAYVQLSTKREEYSIKRAEAFRELMTELLDEEKSRLAVLNLWQLYPDERDRRVITAAAFAVDQPDLVELVAGIDKKVNPVADMLHVRALSSEKSVREPALRTLVNVDPVRAARLLIDGLSEDMEAFGGKLPTQPSPDFNPMQELERLTAQNDTVAQMVKDEMSGKWGMFYDYLLYRARRESGFVGRITAGYKASQDLDLVNDYLYRARFRDPDRSTVITAAGGFLLKSFGQTDRNEFKMAGTLAGLKNGDFYNDLDRAMSTELTAALSGAVSSADHVPLMRRRALELLDSYAPERAVPALVGALVTDSGQSQLAGLAEKHLGDRKLKLLEKRHPNLRLPDCGDQSYVECIKAKPDVWAAWWQNHRVE